MKDFSVPAGAAPIASGREQLLQLRALLITATGPNYALDCKIEHLFEPERARQLCNARPYTASIDAAVTLERSRYVEVLRGPDNVTVQWFGNAGLPTICVRAATDPLARCRARVEYELALLMKPEMGASASEPQPK